MQFHIKAPIFVARQLVKHQVGLVWNEVSRRYVDDQPEFYIPKRWRLRPDKSIKQGSSDETIDYDIAGTMAYVKTTYNNLLREQVAPEMARMVLPQNMYTEWYWSGTLLAYGIDVFHRGTNLTEPGGYRYAMTSCFKKAGNDSIGYTSWPWHFTKPWQNIFEHATPDQLSCFGVPMPGDPFWTEETLSLAQLRYPNWNMSEYR